MDPWSCFPEESDVESAGARIAAVSEDNSVVKDCWVFHDFDSPGIASQLNRLEVEKRIPRNGSFSVEF
jgi:hypothetical protein